MHKVLIASLISILILTAVSAPAVAISRGELAQLILERLPLEVKAPS